MSTYQQLYPRTRATANPSDMGLKKASEIARPTPEPEPKVPAPKASPVTLSVTVMYQDLPVTVSVQAPLSRKNLEALRKKLAAIGLEPIPAPIVWTPEGLPMCPKHRVPMKKREKQGDVWYTHAVKDDAGEVVADAHGDPIYCRGYGGKNSPGWEMP